MEPQQRVLARMAVGEAASYRGACPKISQPTEVACFSRDDQRRVRFDRTALRRYSSPALPAPLDVGFESYVPKQAEPGEPAPLADLLAALDQRSVEATDSGTPLDMKQGEHKS